MSVTCSPTRVLNLTLPRAAAIRLIPPPEDKHSLQRFLGMTNYLAKFIPDYSETTAPLRKLLRQDVDWCWLELHTAAFTKLKELIAGPPVLRYFDVHQPVVLSADASQRGQAGGFRFKGSHRDCVTLCSD